MPDSAFLRIAIFALMLAIPTYALAYEGQEMAGTAKVTMEEARKIALQALPGDITSEELEKESGGSGLRYSFVVKSNKVLYEIGVDAQTGKVLENTKEGENPD
jgi:uncharacterized membrane protein YkoI